MSEQPIGLRERTRRAVQSEIAESALELFLAEGYESTTIEQIAQAAGLSRRSFFRYFSGKDEVLAHTLNGTGRKLAANVRAVPEGTPVWEALRLGMQPMIEQITSDPRALPLTEMMLTGDALQASTGHKQREWLAGLADAALPRLPDHLTAQAKTVASFAIAGAALAALTAAELEWVHSGGDASLESLLDTAMSAVTDTLNLVHSVR